MANEQTLPEPPSRFDKAFPLLASATMELQEVGHMAKSKYPWRVTESDLPVETVPCSNPSCIKGRFAIGGILYDMIRNKQTTIETTRRCHGRERTRDCINVIEIRVTVSYR